MSEIGWDANGSPVEDDPHAWLGRTLPPVAKTEGFVTVFGPEPLLPLLKPSSWGRYPKPIVKIMAPGETPFMDDCWHALLYVNLNGRGFFKDGKVSSIGKESWSRDEMEAVVHDVLQSKTYELLCDIQWALENGKIPEAPNDRHAPSS